MLYDTTMSAGQSDDIYAVDVDISKKADLTVELEGILNGSVRNTYSSGGNNVIYMPYAKLQELINANRTSLSQSSFKSGCKKWAPSAYVVFAKSYNDIQTAIKKITAAGANLQAVSNYQDVESMNKMIESTKHTGELVAVIVLAIIFILMAIIYLNHTLKRKYEFCVLRANGMTRSELFKLVLAESARHVFFVAVISTLLSLALIWAVDYVFSFHMIRFSTSIVIHNIVVSIFSVLIPAIIAVAAVSRFQPDKIMRN